MPKTSKFLITYRSRTTFGTATEEIEVHPGQSVTEVAKRIADGYHADVEGIIPVPAPIDHREALRECLGFVEAWKGHLSDLGRSNAAKTVENTLDRARASYAVQPNPIRTRFIEGIITQHGDDLWAEVEQFPSSDWKAEVEDGSTRLGYWEWVAVKLEEVEIEVSTQG